MLRGNFVFVAVLFVILTGCTPGIDVQQVGDGLEQLVDNDMDQLVSSDVDPGTRPGFASEAQDDDDVLPVKDAESSGLDLATTQYQGLWQGQDVYLGVSGESNVRIIMISPDDPDEWGWSSSQGNVVLGIGDPMTLQYVPEGSASPPEGWRAFSDWMIVRDLP